MAKRLVFLVLMLALAGCTNEVVNMNFDDNDGELGDAGPNNNGRLLDKPGTKSALLGDTRIFTPGIAPTGPIRFVQDFSWITTSADSMSNTNMVTICIDAFPLNFNIQDEADFAFWQFVFNYGTGNALSGAGDVTTGVLGPIKDENVVDIGLGTSICLPPSFVSAKIRMVALQGGGFPGVRRASEPERVTVTLGYGNKTHTQRSTKTDMWGTAIAAPFGPSPQIVANNGQTVFTRPKFANAVQFTWNDYLVATPLTVGFATADGTFITFVTLTGNVTPPPIVQWPESAIYAVVTNKSGVNVQDIRAQNYLTL